MTSGNVSRYVSPKSKLLRFFERSRDRWKAKHHELKKTCKLLQNQVRAVEKSRAVWRARVATLEQRLAEQESEIEQLKCRRRARDSQVLP